MCKECADRCINTDDKYVGLCDDCVLATGIDCGYHPSKKAVARCDTCGNFICGDCFDTAWDGEYGKSGHCCHVCAGGMVEHYVGVDMGYAQHIVKAGMIWIGVLSVIGLIVGLVIQIAGGGSAENIFAGAWLGIGIGCSLRALFRIPRYVFVDSLKAYFKRSNPAENYYVMARLKAWFIYGLLGGLFGGLLVCLIGAFTGPIVPLIYILVRRGQLKKVGLMIERNTKLYTTLRDAHTKPSDSALQAEIRQGASTFDADMKATERILKPVLWFWA